MDASHHHGATVHPNPEMDFGHVKCLVSEAELHQQHCHAHLKASEAALVAAQSQHAGAKAAHDESVARAATLKAQYRNQIMEEGLKQTSRWNDMYYKLLAWKEDHDGDLTVPCEADSDEETKKLSRWVINQRSAYKYFMNGDTKHIKDHRIDALNEIGFVWSVNDQLWDKNFDELSRYHAENGHFDVKLKQNKKLACFISRLRTAMKHQKAGLIQAELTEERISRLNSIGFIWDTKREPRKSSSKETVQFDAMYQHLVSFKETYGHTKVNKLEKEWKKGEVKPDKKVYRRLPLFLAFARKEKLRFDEGQPCSLDAEKFRMLTDLGVEWRKARSEPRKNSGGEASRKKRKIEEPVGGASYLYLEGAHHHHPEEILEDSAGAMGHPELPPIPDPKHEDDLI